MVLIGSGRRRRRLTQTLARETAFIFVNKCTCVSRGTMEAQEADIIEIPSRNWDALIAAKFGE